jgi:hypothetical protein
MINIVSSYDRPDPAATSILVNPDAKILCVQVSCRLFHEEGAATRYYDTVYSKIPGYRRGDDFWEVPLWVARICANFRSVGLLVVRDMDEAKKILASEYLGGKTWELVLFSALDVNKHLIRDLVDACKSPVGIGGHCNMDYFKQTNATIFYSMDDICQRRLGRNDKDTAVDYRLFGGFMALPRLTMSRGCNNNCKFCTVPKGVSEVEENLIVYQVEAFEALGAFNYIYLDDKTFGQCGNYRSLVRMNEIAKRICKSFNGFIIQTTPGQFLKLPEKFIKESGIAIVELGVESCNDHILRKYNKPSTMHLVNRAATRIRDLDLKLVPNIIVGLDGETAETYRKTIYWLDLNADIISHVNAYNLVDYSNPDAGVDENAAKGGLNTDVYTAICEWATANITGRNQSQGIITQYLK